MNNFLQIIIFEVIIYHCLNNTNLVATFLYHELPVYFIPQTFFKQTNCMPLPSLVEWLVQTIGNV